MSHDQKQETPQRLRDAIPSDFWLCADCGMTADMHSAKDREPHLFAEYSEPIAPHTVAFCECACYRLLPHNAAFFNTK